MIGADPNSGLQNTDARSGSIVNILPFRRLTLRNLRIGDKRSGIRLEWWMREPQEPAMNYMRDRAGNAPSWVTQQFPEDGRDKKRPWSVAVGAPHLRKSGNQYTTTREGIQICMHFQVPVNALCPDWQLDTLRALRFVR